MFHNPSRLLQAAGQTATQLASGQTSGNPHTIGGSAEAPFNANATGPTGAPSGPQTGPGAPGGSPVTNPPSPSSGAYSGQSAYDVLAGEFKSWGMNITPDLDAILKQMMTGGYGPNDLNAFLPQIEQTQAFQTRFPGWSQMVKNGYNAISPQQYLNLEDQYHAILSNAGLPKGFYDDPSDFGQWIAQDISPAEIQQRVAMATQAAKSIDPAVRDLMAQHYGLATGDVAAYFLDPDRALPTIERQYNAAQVATWAQKNGFQINDMNRYEDLVDKGVTPAQAAQGYGTVAQVQNTVGKLAGVYGQSFTQSDAENDVFFNQSDKRNRIVSDETAAFQGRSSGATGTAQRTSY